MRSSTRSVAMADGFSVHTYAWQPEHGTPVRAVMHIAHGMAEHGGRYRRLAESLTAAGISVFCHDHRGHGKSTGEAGLGHVSDDGDGFQRIVDDLGELMDQEAKAHPGLPVFLLGHSMGTVIAQTYAGASGSGLTGLILSGPAARPPAALNVVMRPLLAGLTAANGVRGTSSVMDMLAFDAYNKTVTQPRTEYDWLSRDPKEVDEYINQGLGFPMTMKFWSDFLPFLQKLKASEAHAALPSTLPVLLQYGEADPVPVPPTGGHAVTQIQGELKAAGKVTPKVICYPGARHEIFNETNRDEVTRDLVQWLNDVLAGRVQPAMKSRL